MRSVRSGPLDGLGRVWRVVRHWFAAPELRYLRWMILASGAIQLALAPMTSWTSDTTGFVLSEVQYVYRGTPYIGTFQVNPPLGPALDWPFYALLSRYIPAQGFTQTVAALAHVAPISGFVDPVIPTPVALLFLKLPLVAASLVTGIVLYPVMRQVGASPRLATWSAGAWLLNPLMIWATAVHGEYDVYAAAALVGFFFFAFREQWLVAGVALGLGCMGKIYPIFVAPVAVAFLVARSGGRNVPVLRQLGGFLAGLSLGILPFLFLLPAYLSVASSALVGTVGGGISVNVLFDGILPGVSVDSGAALLLVSQIVSWLLLISVAGGSVAVFVVTRRCAGAPGLPRLVLALAVVWGVGAAIQYRPGPVPENLVGLLSVLPVGVLAAPRASRLAFVGATSAGFLLYIGYASPAAYFYPLAVAESPSWVTALNHILVVYFQNPDFPSRFLWFVSGLLGGLVLLAIWVWWGWRLLTITWNAEVRG